MMHLAIDPGNTESAWLVYDPELRKMISWAKEPNDDVLGKLDFTRDHMLSVEMIASYGMPVGHEVFDTCVWIGRFVQRWLEAGGTPVRLVFRKEVKSHLCGSTKAKDSNVRQALIDLFGPGKDVAIGKKATPGPLYGLSGDGWAALGVAVTTAEAPCLHEDGWKNYT